MTIINKEIPAKIVYEDELCLAFHDIQPQAPVHVLVIPKKPIVSVAALGHEDQSLVGHLFLKIAEIARQLGLDSKGYRVITNIGDEGGQSVHHFISWEAGK